MLAIYQKFDFIGGRYILDKNKYSVIVFVDDEDKIEENEYLDRLVAEKIGENPKNVKVLSVKPI